MAKPPLEKVTVQASSDVALIKYWGKKDAVLRLPENGSISMVLGDLTTVTTVEFQDQLTVDVVEIEGESDSTEVTRVSRHLDRVRQLAGIHTKAKVVSKNSFPRGTGLSSSGSGFAALSVAAAHAAGLELTAKELSILARHGSGTACRCVAGGWAEWLDGQTSQESYSIQLYPSDYWDIQDTVVVVDEGKKKVSSTEGHEAARSSIFYQARQDHIHQKIANLKAAFVAKDFTQFGELVESEALEFHSILLTSHPSLLAWYPGTVQVMQAVQELRQQGIEAYFTINTGFNVHVLSRGEDAEKVAAFLQQQTLVQRTLRSRVGEAPVLLQNHLF